MIRLFSRMFFRDDRLMLMFFAIPFSNMSRRMFRGYFRVLALLNVTFVRLSADRDSVLMFVKPVTAKGFIKRISVSFFFLQQCF